MGRTPCCEKVGLKKGPWTAEEDEKLTSYIAKHGHGSWRALPKKAGLLRCGKSCRLRWTNYLRPDIIRGEFSEAEEKTIIQLHALLGNRWSTIASHLPKRTDNEIKNYWNTHLKKRLLKMGIDPITHKPKVETMPAAASSCTNTTTTKSTSCSSITSVTTTNSTGSNTMTATLRGGRDSSLSVTAHMAQWESARLEAEARLSEESKLRAKGVWSARSSTSSRPPSAPISSPPPTTTKMNGGAAAAALQLIVTSAAPAASSSVSRTVQGANIINNTDQQYQSAAARLGSSFNPPSPMPAVSNKQKSWDKCLPKLTWVAGQLAGKQTENAVNDTSNTNNNNNMFTHINNNGATNSSVKLHLRNSTSVANNVVISSNHHLTLLDIKKHLDSKSGGLTQSFTKDSKLPYLLSDDKTDMSSSGNYTSMNAYSLQDLSDRNNLFANTNCSAGTAKFNTMSLNPHYAAQNNNSNNNNAPGADSSITIPASINDLLNDNIHSTAIKPDIMFGTATQSGTGVDGTVTASSCSTTNVNCTSSTADHQGASNNSPCCSLPLSLLCLQDLIEFDDPNCTEANMNAGAATCGAGAACSIIDEIERIVNSSSPNSEHDINTITGVTANSASKLSQKFITHYNRDNHDSVNDNNPHHLHNQLPADFNYCSINALMDQDLSMIF